MWHYKKKNKGQRVQEDAESNKPALRSVSISGRKSVKSNRTKVMREDFVF